MIRNILYRNISIEISLPFVFSENLVHFHEILVAKNRLNFILGHVRGSIIFFH